MSILFTSVFSGLEIIWDRQFGFLKETLVAPVSRLEIMLGRTLGGAAVAVFQGLIVLTISFLAGFRVHSLSGLIPAFLVMGLTAVLFTALGTSFASLLDDMQGFQLIMNFIIMPLFFLSGALFPLKGLPKLLNFITQVNPLSYGVDGLRATLLNAAHFGLSLDLVVLSTLTALFLFIGSFLFSRIQI